VGSDSRQKPTPPTANLAEQQPQQTIEETWNSENSISRGYSKTIEPSETTRASEADMQSVTLSPQSAELPFLGLSMVSP
jgi:hypothetical protein